MFTRTLALLGVSLAAFAAAASSLAAQTGTARLGTYEKDGQQYFALSLLPQVAADPAQKNEVVILVDTSASQTGRYRAEQMSALSSALSAMSPETKVLLMAVDMKVVPMSGGFVAPQGPQMQAALTKLAGRTPLGATDLDAGLRSAAASFSPTEAARTVIYIGDAVSKANVLTPQTLTLLVNDLKAARVSVSSYVVGQEHNLALAAALANHTGGLVQAAQPMADASRRRRGLVRVTRAAGY
jgi:uncharacterized protein with von Willebrand factor type A (vWA) domain